MIAFPIQEIHMIVFRNEDWNVSPINSTYHILNIPSIKKILLDFFNLLIRRGPPNTIGGDMCDEDRAHHAYMKMHCFLGKSTKCSGNFMAASMTNEQKQHSNSVVNSNHSSSGFVSLRRKVKAMNERIAIKAIFEIWKCSRK